jgi:hypothetical protein
MGYCGYCVFKQYKVGDVVRIKDCKDLSIWQRKPDVIGKKFTLTQQDISDMSRGAWHPENNKYCINFSDNMLELVSSKQPEPEWKLLVEQEVKRLKGV